MRLNKRLVLLLVLLAITVTAVFSACGKPDETGVLEAFKALYEKSIAINEYVYGAGLPSDTPWDEQTIPQYEELSDEAPYKTRAELEKAILEVYSGDYYNDAMVYGLFSGYGESQKLSARYSEKNGALTVDVSDKGRDVSGRFDTSTSVIVELSYEHAVISATYTKGDSVSTYELSMVMTQNGWRFDIPTF